MLISRNSKLYNLVKDYKLEHEELIKFDTNEMVETMCGYMQVGDETMIREAFETLKTLGKDLDTDLVPVFHALGYELGYTDAEVFAVYLED